MDENFLNTLLKSYYDLLNRVDDKNRHVEKKYPGKIACKKGCDSCCKFLTLFSVEAFSLSKSFIKLPLSTQELIFKKVEKNENACPLLIKGTCALYSNRPIICRTHGYPIYLEKGNEIQIDFCPKNFKRITSFPKDVLLSIERLNSALVAINHHFLEFIETNPPLPERIPVSEAIFLLKEE